MTEIRDSDSESRPLRRTWIVIALAVLGIVVIAVLVARMVAGGANPDRLPDNEVEEAGAGEAQDLCASQRVYDAIKGELFRRAAQVRGEDEAAFGTIARHSAVRMDSPVVTGQNDDLATIECSGMLYLDLPPGVVAAGNRRTLSADIGYTLHRMANDGTEVIALQNFSTIIGPLSALARTPDPSAVTINMMDPALEGLGELLPVDPLAPATPASPAEPAEPPTTPAPVPGPSFDCADARTRSEVAVCNDAGLAELDREMAQLYGRALGGADAEQRALLVRTRDRFLAYRDGCRSDDCIADAYRGRMREIRDILAGRWQPPR